MLIQPVYGLMKPTLRTLLLCSSITGLFWISTGCIPKKADVSASFTEADSLTEIILNLQDSLLITWNQMISDDNAKIKAMQFLLHEIEIGGQIGPDEVKALQQRIEQLKSNRFNAKNINQEELVEEYDFASNSLVSELITLAEANSAYSYNSTMQKLVEQIRMAEQRVENYRVKYDDIAVSYNAFIHTHHQILSASENKISLETKALFHTVAE